MKHLTFVVFFIISSYILYAQETVILLNFNSLKKKVEKSNAEIANPKASKSAKTWFKRGELLQDVFVCDIQQIYDGMNSLQLKLFYKEPLKESDVTINRKTYHVLEYDRMHYYFLNDGLSAWKRIKIAFDNPLDEAYNSFIKAIELDQAMKYSNDIKVQLTNLKRHYKQLGINDYFMGSKEKGLESFEKVVKISDLPLFKGEKDTLMIQYSGIVSRELGDYKKAIDYYKQLKEIRKDPNVYLSLNEDYMQLKDTASALSILEEGFTIFPDSTNIVASLVDLCIKTNRIGEGLNSIDKAISRNPSNSLFHYWKGRLILKSAADDVFDKSILEYNKALELDPKLSYGYYDIGWIYFVIGQDYFKRAGEEKDIKTRELLNKEGTNYYNKAIPMFEKAVELSEKDKIMKRESLDNLKRIYYKLQMMDKYNEVNEKLKTL